MRWMVRAALVAAVMGVGLPAVDAEEKATIVVTIAKDGRTTLTHGGTTLAQVGLGTDDVEAQAKSLATVRAALAAAAKPAALQAPDGTSRLRLEVVAGPTTPWRRIQWLVQVGAHPTVKIWQITLRRSDAPQSLDFELPRDSGLAVGPPKEFGLIKIKFFRKNKGVAKEAFTRIRVNNSRADMVELARGGVSVDDQAETMALGLSRLSKILRSKRAAHSAESSVVVRMALMPPDGGDTPFGDVFPVVRLVQNLKLGSLEFEGAVPPGFGTHVEEELEETPLDAPPTPVITAVVRQFKDYGVLEIRDLDESLLGGGVLGMERSADTLASVVDLLAAATHRATDREPDGSARFVLRIRVDPKAPWRHVQWLMQSGAHPRVKITRLELSTHGGSGMAPVRVSLPKDVGLMEGKEAPPPPEVVLRLFRKDASLTELAWTKIKTTRADADKPGPIVELRPARNGSAREQRASTLASLERWLVTQRTITPKAVAVIAAMPPSGGKVPWSDMREVIQAVESAGLADLVFEGAAPPLKRKPK